MNLGLMYWAPPEYVLGGSSGLVFGAEVETIESRAAEHPELRGPTIVEATLRVDRVLRQIDPPRADRPARRLRPDDVVHSDGAEGLAVGDRVLVFASTYDGGYGIVPKRGTRTPIGIIVRTWSDPIVGAVRRWLDDESSWSADVETWRPYGEGAIECMRQPIPMSHCDR